MKTALSFSFVVGLFLVTLLFHVVSIEFALYWTFPWLDMLMHFLGGLASGSLGIWLGVFILREKRVGWGRKKILFILIPLFSALLIGILWEFYELGFVYHAQTSALFGGWSIADTRADLVLDCFGGVTAGMLFLLRRRWKKDAE